MLVVFNMTSKYRFYCNDLSCTHAVLCYIDVDINLFYIYSTTKGNLLFIINNNNNNNNTNLCTGYTTSTNSAVIDS